MASFGISENAPVIEKIKQEFNDNLYGFNMVGDIDYETYSKIYDMAMPLFEKAFEEGTKEKEETPAE